ncbi:lysozyme family protein [Burkholderia metallica]|uniref:hypothetical protein n=1 Tax=Burkholderia metallica TaxID=488729 RepID=UPI001CF52BB5|nr:hypothetical protein [Burkholderia metallica]MCA8003498.1 hypothetical protein [Burkholderia metallica]
MSGLSVQGNCSSYLLQMNGVGACGEPNLEQQMQHLLQDLQQILSQIHYDDQGGGMQSGGDGDDGGMGGFTMLGAMPFSGASSVGAVGASSSVPFDAGTNQAIGQWSSDIEKAAKLTGLDPNLIGAQMWAESRGNAGSDENSTNMDGTTDRSLMQIGDERWQNDVIPTLSDQDKAAIKQATGKDPEQLDMSDPHDNVVAGAFELRSHIVNAGGDASNPMANSDALMQALAAYRGVGDGQDEQYAQQIVDDAHNLRSGRQLDDNEAL